MSSLPPPPPPPSGPPPSGPLPQPPAAVPPPAYGAPQPGLPQPPAKSGMNGCAIAAIVLVVLLVLGGVGVFVVGAVVINKGKDKLEQATGGNLDLTVGDCPVLSNSKAKELFGANAEATTIPLEGLIGFAFDDRVLRDSDSCWVNNADQQSLIVLHHREGGDARAAYQKERDLAQPTSQDQGGGLTLENEGYFDKDVSGLGDEAFCTGSSLSGATGVLVRKGDRLLYLSISPGPDEFDPSQLGTKPDSAVITNETLCNKAQDAARSIIG